MRDFGRKTASMMLASSTKSTNSSKVRYLRRPMLCLERRPDPIAGSIIVT